MLKTEDRKKLGFVHVYTGEGQGSHEVSLGYAMRAIGHGLCVVIIQFFKEPKERGEHLLAERLKPQFRVIPFRPAEPMNLDRPTPTDRFLANEGLNAARRCLHGEDRPDLLILEDINPLIALELLAAKDVIDVLDNAPPNIEMILTGHPVHDHVRRYAHIVTECLPIKSVDGLRSRKGIDH